jgi:lipopolysaccharide transport system ATP-binding protein
MAIIAVDHVTKEYRLGAMHDLKHTLLNTAARLTGRKVAERPLFKALDDVSFTVEQGEVVGIIGHNGAGKSTLLKMLARISTPTHGSVMVNGRIAPLIEVGAGFVPDFTGRENVYLNGSILGMPRKEIDKKFDEIVAFAEMEEFIDTPVKRYSSGMQVKLAFAVATSIETEILIVDEVLAVGDLAFQRKCFDRTEELIKKQNKTVLLVSHNIRQVERICSRVIFLDHGKVLRDGSPRDVCNLFYEVNNDKILDYARSQALVNHNSVTRTGELDVEDCNIYLYGHDVPVEQITIHDNIVVAITFRANIDLDQVDVVVGFHTTDLVYIATANTGVLETNQNFKQGRHTVNCQFPDIPLMPGVYGVRIGFLDRRARQMWYAENYRTFKVSAPNISVARISTVSMVDLHVNWSFIDHSEDTSALA